MLHFLGGDGALLTLEDTATQKKQIALPLVLESVLSAKAVFLRDTGEAEGEQNRDASDASSFYLLAVAHRDAFDMRQPKFAAEGLICDALKIQSISFATDEHTCGMHRRTGMNTDLIAHSRSKD